MIKKQLIYASRSKNYRKNTAFRNNLLIISFLSILGLLIRLYLLYQNKHFYYLAQPYPDAVEYAMGGFNFFVGHPLQILIQNKWYPIRYDPGFSILLVPFMLLGKYFYGGYIANLTFSTLTTIFIYLSALKLFNKKVAFFATLLFIFSSGFIAESLTVLSETPSALFGALILYLTAVWADSKNKHYLIYLISFICGFSVLIRYTNVFFVIIPFSFMLLQRRNVLKNWIRLSSFIILFILIELSINTFLYGSPLKTGYSLWAGNPTSFFSFSYIKNNLIIFINDFLGIKDFSTMSYMINSVKFMYLPIYSVFLGLIALIIAKLKHKTDFIKLVIILAPLAGLVVFYSLYYIKDFRFIIPGLVFLYIVIGYGVDKLLELFRPNFLKVLVCLFFILYFLYSFPTFFIQYKNYSKNLNSNEQSLLIHQKYKNKVLFTADDLVYWERILGKSYNVLPLNNTQEYTSTIDKNYKFTNELDMFKKQNIRHTYYVMKNNLSIPQWQIITNYNCVSKGDSLYYGYIIRFHC